MTAGPGNPESGVVRSAPQAPEAEGVTFNVPIELGSAHLQHRVWARPGSRHLVAVGVAVVVAALVAWVRASEFLDGYLGACAAAVLVLAVPTSRLLARRIALAGCIAFGWLPLTYWSPLPVGPWGRVTISLALVTAGLALWVLGAADPAARLRRLLPAVGVIDVLLVVTAGAAAFFVKPWLTVQTGPAALSIMFRGWDHSAHYFMTEAARRTGAFADLLGASDTGDTYKFAQYPSSFHVVVATVMELLGSPVPGNSNDELALYAQAVGLCVVVTVTMVVASLCALPVVRRNRNLAIPFVAAIVATFLLGTGGSLLRDGFPNFLVACALLATIPPLVVTWGRLPTPITTLAIGGAITAIAGSWALLLVIALPTVLVGVAPWRRGRWSGPRRTWIVVALILVATVASVARAAHVLSQTEPTFDELLGIPGDISIPPGGHAVFITIGAMAACLWLLTKPPVGHGQRRVGQISRAAWMCVPLAIGVGAAGYIAQVELRTPPYSGYYFWKFTIGLTLFAVVVLVMALATRAWIPASGTRRTARLRFVGACVAAVAVTHAYGVLLPALSNAGFGQLAPGAAMTRDMRVASIDPQLNESARRLIAGEAIPTSLLGPRPVYIDPGGFGHVNPIKTAQWFLALTNRWTEESNATVSGLRFDDPSLADSVVIVKQLLLSDPQAVVVIPADFADRIRAAVGDPALTARILDGPR